jgi:hypothetical protein
VGRTGRRAEAVPPNPEGMDGGSRIPGARIQFGRVVCGDVAAGLRREWLVTNGLGAYASGTLAGPNTRRYHGLLVAALPPAGRTMMVAGLVEWATYDAARYPPTCATSSYAARGRWTSRSRRW